MHAWIEQLGTALEALGVTLLVGGPLFGLEVPVAADIVRSVALAPSMASLSVLAAIVAIRTFLSWSLALELDGRCPWQRPQS